MYRVVVWPLRSHKRTVLRSNLNRTVLSNYWILQLQTFFSTVDSFSTGRSQQQCHITWVPCMMLFAMKLCHPCCYFRRTCHDVLDLVELCLDFDLQGNQLRLRFNGSLIADVSVQETSRDVVFLVTTTNSVHRLTFTHPAVLHAHVRHTSVTPPPSSSIWPHLSYGLVRSKREYYHNCSLVVFLCSFL